MVSKQFGDLLLIIGWEEVSLEGLPAVSGEANFGGNPAANQHDMGQQPTERQLRAKLFLEVPEVAAGWQRLVHILTEHILSDNVCFNISVSLRSTQIHCQLPSRGFCLASTKLPDAVTVFTVSIASASCLIDVFWTCMLCHKCAVLQAEYILVRGSQQSTLQLVNHN